MASVDGDDTDDVYFAKLSHLKPQRFACLRKSYTVLCSDSQFMCLLPSAVLTLTNCTELRGN